MTKNTGVRRIFKAAFYSYKGISFALRHEAAFRQEVLAACFLIPFAFWVDVAVIERVLMLMVVFLVLIIELINTAIEAVVDRIGPEHHVLAGVAKDAGSAAVLLGIVLVVLVWGSILFAG